MRSKNVFKKIESILLKVCVLSLLFIVGLQLLVSRDDFPTFIGNGNNSMESSSYNEKGIVRLSLLGDNYEDVEVLVNGEAVGNFNDNKEVELLVYNNDLIEINGTKHMDKIKVKVVAVSTNLNSPKLDSIVTTSKNIELLGKVVIK
ncbi:hypothetical protein [Sporosalibacterium faouarense]|uniref:hypothetical protein n=1 Tax=Sporosalibacterium faouarense TaxID=516123 RepID=UPI00192C4BFD|nr:hypothetical protein [Sporosalibacterium faouarense]